MSVVPLFVVGRRVAMVAVVGFVVSATVVAELVRSVAESLCCVSKPCRASWVVTSSVSIPSRVDGSMNFFPFAYEGIHLGEVCVRVVKHNFFHDWFVLCRCVCKYEL